VEFFSKSGNSPKGKSGTVLHKSPELLHREKSWGSLLIANSGLLFRLGQMGNLQGDRDVDLYRALGFGACKRVVNLV